MRTNILFVGSSAGSWEVRGRQIGKAMGARWTSQPGPDDWAWAEVVILVKHAAETFATPARLSRARIVWDVLDVWKQPEENRQTIVNLRRNIQAIAERANACCLIGATQSMAGAIGGVYLPHHSRPGLQPARPRPELKVVAYEGTPKYLGAWLPALEQACARLGLEFVINPADLREADLVVALRSGQWDGDACRQWKSGVKYVNAIAAGRPVLTQNAAAFHEIGPPGGLIQDPSEIEVALRLFRHVEARQHAYEECVRRASEFTLNVLVRRYHALVESIMEKAA